jgi:hypothetical protein
VFFTPWIVREQFCHASALRFLGRALLSSTPSISYPDFVCAARSVPLWPLNCGGLRVRFPRAASAARFGNPYFAWEGYGSDFAGRIGEWLQRTLRPRSPNFQSQAVQATEQLYFRQELGIPAACGAEVMEQVGASRDLREDAVRCRAVGAGVSGSAAVPLPITLGPLVQDGPCCTIACCVGRAA